ncbi:MAG: glycosyltransferase family 4 protein, partial [Methyloceanibacter sp.]|nr:glycosyltransferase family 4 protein [Methyloceanibacter sp.]
MTAGAGGLDCEACAHDALLMDGLRDAGHAVFAPTLYTPPVGRTAGPIFYGGINVFLQQRWNLFRKTPRFIDWIFDRALLLRLLSHVAISIEPEELGEMTVSVLKGEAGRQRKELNRLINHLSRMSERETTRPDVVVLPNSLLSALALPLKQRLGLPVLCVLQGEEGFVASMPQPYHSDAHALIRRHAESIDAFISPSDAYAQEMSVFLAVERQRIRTIRTGIDVGRFARKSARQREPFRIGYFSDISPAKGIDVLVEAFRTLARKPGGNIILTVARKVEHSQQAFWTDLRRSLTAEGPANRLEHVASASDEHDAEILRTCSVVCVPSLSIERHGLVCLKAMAAGVPVVASDVGVFPELVGLTGGGLIVPAGDATALADAIASLHRDSDKADLMGKAGAEGAANPS